MLSAVAQTQGSQKKSGPGSPTLTLGVCPMQVMTHHRDAGPLLRSRAFLDCEDLVGRHISQRLPDATGPANFDFANHFRCAQAEVNPRVARAGIPTAVVAWLYCLEPSAAVILTCAPKPIRLLLTPTSFSRIQ